MLGQNEVATELDDETYRLFVEQALKNGKSPSDWAQVLIRRDAGLADENRAAQMGQKETKKTA